MEAVGGHITIVVAKNVVRNFQTIQAVGIATLMSFCGFLHINYSNFVERLQQWNVK